jgi:uncharacterized coiled-coil protein SlyX
MSAEFDHSERTLALQQAASMATLESQQKSILEGMLRTERTLEKLDTIGSAVVELRVIADANKQTFSRLFTRLEKVEASLNHDEQIEAQINAQLANKANLSDLAGLGGRIDGFIGHIKGGLIVASIFAAAIQTAVFGGFAYVVTHTQNTETGMAVLAQRIDQLEKSIHTANGKTSWERLNAPLQSSSTSKRT